MSNTTDRESIYEGLIGLLLESGMSFEDGYRFAGKFGIVNTINDRTLFHRKWKEIGVNREIAGWRKERLSEKFDDLIGSSPDLRESLIGLLGGSAELEKLRSSGEVIWSSEARDLLSPARYGDWCRAYFPHLCTSAISIFQRDTFLELIGKRKIIQMRCWHRGAGKSTHARTLIPIWMMLTKQCRRFDFIGAEEIQAKAHLKGIREELSSNSALLSAYNGGKSMIVGGSKGGKGSSYAVDSIGDCYFRAWALEQSVRGTNINGLRLQYVVIDDIESDTKSISEGVLLKHIKTITGGILPGFSNDGFMKFVICNNKHRRNGLIERLENKWRRSGLEYFSYSQIDLLRARPFGKLDLDEYGDSEDKTTKLRRARESASWMNYTWRGVYEAEFAYEKSRSMGRTQFDREYMNVPLSDRNVFHPENFKYYEGEKEDYRERQLFMFWDFSRTLTGDYKAGVLIDYRVGRDLHPMVSGQAKGRLQFLGMYVLDLFCLKCEIEEAMRWHFEKSEYWRGRCRNIQCFYDATSTQKDTYEPLLASVHEGLGLIGLMPDPVSQGGREKKKDRIISSLEYKFKSKIVYFNDKIDKHHMDNAYNQMISFTKDSRAHDDFPDALAAAAYQANKYYVASAFTEADGLYGVEEPSTWTGGRDMELDLFDKNQSSGGFGL